MDEEPEAKDMRLPAHEVENKLRQAARSFAFPETPNIAARERQRLLAHQDALLTGKGKQTAAAQADSGKSKIERKRLIGLAFAVAAALIIGLMLVTPVRARLIEWLRIGAVRIFLNQPRITPEPAQPSSLDDMAGKTTLAQAMDAAPFSLLLPSYPPDLGDAQWVYLQKINDTTAVIFVWQDPKAQDAARLALYQIGNGDAFQKQLWQDFQETTVNGHWALWIEGPYLLLTQDGQTVQRRVVQGRTLLWTENGITYRLETSLTLDEARKIAESLIPIQR